MALADLLEAEGRLLRRRSLETLALALLLAGAAASLGLGALALALALYLWLAPQLGAPATLALLGGVALSVGGATAWRILEHVRRA